MNKNIIIIFLISFLNYFFNNISNYEIINKIIKNYNKNLFLLFNFFFYLGGLIGNIYFYKKKRLRNIKNTLIIYFLIINIIFICNLYSKNLYFIFFNRTLNGFLINNILNNIEFYINILKKKLNYYYCSFIYFILFIGQIFFSYVNNSIILQHLKLFFFIIIIFINNFIFLIDDIDIKTNNTFKNTLNFKDSLFLLLSLCLNNFNYIINNYVSLYYKNDKFFQTYFINSSINYSSSIAIFFLHFFKYNFKKKIYLKIMFFFFILLNTLNYFIKIKIIVYCIMISLEICIFLFYYITLNIFNKKKINKNNCLYIFINSLSYMLNPIFAFFFNKNNIIFFYNFLKIISFVIFLIVFFLNYD